MRKLLFAALTIASLALTASAAQFDRDFTATTLINTATTGGTITNAATLSPTNMTVTLNGARYVGIYTSFTLNGNKTNSPTVKFAKSVDGTNFETTPSITLAAVTLSGVSGTALNAFDQVQTEGVKAIKLVSILNGASDQAITNLVVKVGFATPPR